MKEAEEVLKKASSPYGISASGGAGENYGHVWARDSAVSGLAIIASSLENLYPTIEKSYLLLLKAAASNGQIPSNVKLNEQGEIISISFGGVAGRTDASFWWIIGSIHLVNKFGNSEFEQLIQKQCEAIFKLAEAWEFNGKNLMYLPMSSNWADEYVTHGYVLYDQLLRYWALYLAGRYFRNEAWRNKAELVKKAIKKHYLMEAETAPSLFTEVQMKELGSIDISERFLASFSPGDRLEQFDGWSIGLLLMLGIPSAQSTEKLEKALRNAFSQTGNRGIPAFWPVIEEGHWFEALKKNNSYRFKNAPGHFHNGGIWPVVNGFVVAGLSRAGLHSTAELLSQALAAQSRIHHSENPFAEYYNFYNGRPGGVNNLCFSASGYLIAQNSINKSSFINEMILPDTMLEGLRHSVLPIAGEVIALFKTKSPCPIAVSIAGESGCGKTTLSKLLQEILASNGIKSLVLHQDEYFKLPPKQNHLARENNFDHIGPQEVRLDLIEQHILTIKTRTATSITIPVMNWETDTEEEIDINVAGIQVVIVEGTYTTLLGNLDHKIFIDTSYLDTRSNRINRNREEVTDFIERVLAKESAIIQSQKTSASVILDSNFKTLS